MLLKRLLEFINIDLYLFQLMLVLCAIYGAYNISKLKKPILLDCAVILYIIYIIINTLGISYTNHWQYVYRATIIQFFPIFCYFIGRQRIISLEYVLSNMKYPIIIAMVAGIYLFFTHPSWYVEMKSAQLNGSNNENFVLEIYRLSSFWGHPYYIAYATLLFTIYMIFRINKKENNISDYFILFICCIVLLLAQMRVTIVGALFAYFYINKSKINFSTIVGVGIFSFFVVVVMINVLDIENTAYIIEHFQVLLDSSSYSDRFQHTSGGITDYSFFGDGFGRYDLTARFFDKFAIVDNEFQNHLAELGYIGLSFLLFILVYTTYMALCVRKACILETSVFLFYLMSLIGASVLSNETQYNYVMWYTIGLICSNRSNGVAKSFTESRV